MLAAGLGKSPSTSKSATRKEKIEMINKKFNTSKSMLQKSKLTKGTVFDSEPVKKDSDIKSEKLRIEEEQYQELLHVYLASSSI